MENIRNLSIRKTILLYMLLNLLASFLLYAILLPVADSIQRQIWWKYTEEQWEFGYTRTPVRPPMEMLSKADSFVSELCDFVQTYGFLTIATIGTVIAVFVFYSRKIQKPLLELEAASRAIAADDLDFSVAYQNGDELGRLCAEFEKMRKRLEKNSRQMWRLLEQEKALRAAVSHELRSPLAVVKGYQEMLLEYVPEDFDREKTVEMLREGMKQLDRIEIFLDRMRRLSRLEDREPEPKQVELATFFAECKGTAKILSDGTGICCEFTGPKPVGMVWVDRELVMEVFENLLENALRYARHTVQIGIFTGNGELTIVVEDDGAGFGTAPEHLSGAWHYSNPLGDRKHFGLGLYLCRIYCEKHDGRLFLKNREDGGASVAAVFGAQTRAREI